MKRSVAPARPLQKYRRIFASNVPKAIDGDVEGLHDARVATRRLREALAVLLADLPKSLGRKLRRRLRRVTRALGPVRELDVADQLLAELARSRAAPTDAVRAIRRWVAGERATCRRVMRRRMKPAAFQKTRRALLAVERDVRVLPAGSGWAGRLASRISRRSDKVRQTMRDAGRLYNSERIHAVRIALKQLRYSLEFADQAGVARCQALAERIKTAQDCLGLLHDQEVVLGQVRTMQGTPNSGDAPAARLELVARGIEDACRQLHARYLTDQARIEQACLKAVAVAEAVRPVQAEDQRHAPPLKMTLGSATPARRRAARR